MYRTAYEEPVKKPSLLRRLRNWAAENPAMFFTSFALPVGFVAIMAIMYFALENQRHYHDLVQSEIHVHMLRGECCIKENGLACEEWHRPGVSVVCVSHIP